MLVNIVFIKGGCKLIYNFNKINTLDDFFKTSRTCVYFYRIETRNDIIDNFLIKYKSMSKKTMSNITEHLLNPNPKTINKYQQILGNDFYFNSSFISINVKKWIPGFVKSNELADTIYKTLLEVKQSGKNDNAIKNLYIKLMCWLDTYFKMTISACNKEIPKILFEIYPTEHELIILDILSKIGCDIVLLLREGDAEYLKIDKFSKKSILYHATNEVQLTPSYVIPVQAVNKSNTVLRNTTTQKTVSNFTQRSQNIVQMPQNNMSNKIDNSFNVISKSPECKYIICTNAWLNDTSFNFIETNISLRGNEANYIYNVFIQYNGIWDNNYLNDLYQFYSKVSKANRPLLIIDSNIQSPKNEEIAVIPRKQYNNLDQLIDDFSIYINNKYSKDLSSIIIKAFRDIIVEESKSKDITINKISNKAIMLLCWLFRYKDLLFKNWIYPNVSCVIYLGGCKNNNEALFMRFLSKLPVDVILLNPDLNNNYIIENEKSLLVIDNEKSMNVDKYPTDSSQFRAGTVAYHAERELDTLMYQDSGIYRSYQYSKANSLSLNTMYEEISILWDQELKFRPNFDTVNSTVIMPVIFSKVSGVKDGNIKNYWSDIQKLMTKDTTVVTKLPFITVENEYKDLARLFMSKDGILRDRIKHHRIFNYKYLKEDVIEYMFDKLDLLINNKTIKGTLEYGKEYNIIATVLSIPKNIIRQIQAFDFTKKNPKLIYILTDETMLSLEDTILACYLNLIGFDILFYVPTGYQCIERYLNINIEEHNIGQYIYDTQIPFKLNNGQPNEQKQSIFKKLFG